MLKFILLLTSIPLFTNCETQLSKADFIRNFQKCNKLTIEGKAYKNEAIIYFKVSINESSYELNTIIGHHDKEVYIILRQTLECMIESRISADQYEAIYIIEKLSPPQKTIQSHEKERESLISTFSKIHKLPKDIDTIVTGFGKTIR